MAVRNNFCCGTGPRAATDLTFDNIASPRWLKLILQGREAPCSPLLWSFDNSQPINPKDTPWIPYLWRGTHILTSDGWASACVSMRVWVCAFIRIPRANHEVMLQDHKTSIHSSLRNCWEVQVWCLFSLTFLLVMSLQIT